MIDRRRHVCRVHREQLALFATGRDPQVITAAALEHLDRCRRCREETEELALLTIALERLGTDAAEATAVATRPSGGDDPSWNRLRARIRRPQQAWRWRSQLGGLLLSGGLVAAFIGPVSAGPSHLGPAEEPGVDAVQAATSRVVDRRMESAWLRANAVARKETPIVVTFNRPYDPTIYGEQIRRTTTGETAEAPAIVAN
jgi:hypothetical protein